MSKDIFLMIFAILAYSDNTNLIIQNEKSLMEDHHQEKSNKNYTLDIFLKIVKLKYIQSLSDKKQDFLAKALNIPSELNIKLLQSSYKSSKTEIELSIGIDAITHYMLSVCQDSQAVNAHMAKMLDACNRLVSQLIVIVLHNRTITNINRAIHITNEEMKKNISPEEQRKYLCNNMQLNLLSNKEYFEYNTALNTLSELTSLDIADIVTNINVDDLLNELLNYMELSLDITDLQKNKLEQLQLNIKSANYQLYDTILSGLPRYSGKYELYPEIKNNSQFTWSINLSTLKKIRANRSQQKQAENALNKYKQEIYKGQVKSKYLNQQSLNQMSINLLLFDIAKDAYNTAVKQNQNSYDAELNMLSAERTYITSIVKYYNI